MEDDTPTCKLMRYYKLRVGACELEDYGPQFGSTNRNENGKGIKTHRRFDGDRRKYSKYSRTTTIQY
jgi:hypothetical protein